MYWNRKHVLVCTASHCMQKGANNVAGRLRIELKRRGLDHDIMVNTCDSIELCDIGPNIVVYPDGIIYAGVGTGDLKDLIEHLQGGEPVERLILTPETPAEAAREQFFREAVVDGPAMPEDAFAALAELHGLDTNWIAEQARRGFIARKAIDGVASIVVTTKAYLRYRITLPATAE
jgi:(2Fe-2S) ferredoxin